jgi:hypothetical protein
MEEQYKNTDLQPKKTTLAIIRIWAMIIATLSVLFGIIFAYQLNPDILVFKILWFMLWLGVLPSLLVWSYVILTKKGKGPEK